MSKAMLSNTAYNFSETLKALQVKKNFIYGLVAFLFLSGILHMVGNSYLKIANAVVVLFLVTVWLVKWEGKSNRQVFYIGLLCTSVSALMIILTL
jgi:hypothetical protein